MAQLLLDMKRGKGYVDTEWLCIVIKGHDSHATVETSEGVQRRRTKVMFAKVEG